MLCPDVDECSLELFSCSNSEYCKDTVGDYECVCREGFISNGSLCEGN